MQKIVFLLAFSALFAKSVDQANAGTPNQLIPLQDASIIAGTLRVSDECRKGEIEAWLSVGPTLVYQADLPMNGNFEMHVQPGEYDLVINSSTGCLIDRKISVEANKVTSLTMNLVKHQKRSPATARPIDCATCMGYNVVPPVVSLPSAQSFYSSNYFIPPWYMPYGTMSYSNFNYPSPWSGRGMNTRYFPGGGNVGMLKPNVYLYGTKGTTFTIKAEYKDDSNVLIAVPQHGTKGWNGRLAANDKIIADSATYSFLYYDYLSYEHFLQNERGFCVKTKEDFIDRAIGILKNYGFRENAVTDFKQQWAMKTPKSTGYCVYPQDHRQLDQVVRFDVKPTDAKLSRLIFVVITEEMLKQGGNKFAQTPKKDWMPDLERRKLANNPSLEIHEWGVGVLKETQ